MRNLLSKYRGIIWSKIQAIYFEFLHVIKHFQKKKNLIILDDLYPHPLSTFRNIEFSEYLTIIKDTEIHSTGNAFKAIHENRSINTVIDIFDRRVKNFNHHRPLHAKLIYCIFLCNTHGFLKTIERNKAPFIFTLYPGGEFLLNNPVSDNKLKQIFQSKYFKKVIVTQKITKEYLIKNKLCSESKIEFIFGVVSPLTDNQIWQLKKIFPTHKTTIDICFVANKQIKYGLDKGYDLFIETIKIIQPQVSNLLVHIIGPYDENDWDIKGIVQLKFYGFLSKEQLSDFFIDKDIIISPNRAFVLQEGAFDGFPTAACTEASANGVAMFVADPLGQNFIFEEGKEIIIINENPQDIAKMVLKYTSNIQELYQLAKWGLIKTQNIYSYPSQINPRIQLITDNIK